MTQTLEEQIRARLPAQGDRDERRTIYDIFLALAQEGLIVSHIKVIDVASRIGGDPVYVLGGHLHERKTEHFLLARGSGRLMVADPEEGNEAAFPIVAGEFFRMPRGIAHSFELSPESLLIGYVTETEPGYDPRDPSDDIPYTFGGID